MEKYSLLASIIAAHPERKLVGRTRLQKSVYLMQRRGKSLGYAFRMYLHGPYSDGLQADIGVLEELGLVHESNQVSQTGRPYSVFEAPEPVARSPLEEDDLAAIRSIAAADPVALELAATLDAFRQAGLDEKSAVAALRKKKADRWSKTLEEQALELLDKVGLAKI